MGRWLLNTKELNLLGDQRTAMASLAAMSAWHGFGFNVLLYLVTLAGIPRELYEAAAVDGADRWGTFWGVTVPLLRPAIYLVTVLGAIGSLKVFGPMFIMTGGGPANSTVSVVQYIYQTAFTFGDLRFGYAAAQAFLLAIVVLAFAVTASRLNRPVDR
jgi:ABC-type sugar transport system permease subunit